MSEFDDLINKQFTVPIAETKHFDNSDKYVIEKKTRSGTKKVLKPEIVKQIKARLEQEN